jgi:CHAT domain-containing protein/Tfp pilus assembly protein PilF
MAWATAWAADPPTAESLSLQPGVSQEREIQGGQSLSFDLQLPAGTFLEFEVILWDPSLAPRLLSPAGEVVAKGEGGVPQLLAAIADHGGTYRLELAAPVAQKSSKRFTVRILELRPAAAGDEKRVRGAKLLLEARQLALATPTEAQRKQAEALIAEALAALRAAGDARGEVEALIETSSRLGERGDMPGALGWLEKALKKSRESGLPEWEAISLSSMGYCQGRLGSSDEAIEFFKRSLEIWQKVGRPQEVASALQRLGLAYQRKQDYESQMRVFKEALTLAEASGDLTQQGRALSGLGASHYYLGRPGEAREIWEKALELLRQEGDAKTEVLVENNLAVLYHNQGQFQRALELYTRLVQKAVAPKDVGLMRANMGSLYAELGNPAEALENLKLASEAYHTVGDLENEGNVLVSMGMVRQQVGDPRAALAEYEKARQVLPEAWCVVRSLGMVQTDLGKPEEALPLLRKALEIAKASGDRAKVAATQSNLGLAYAKLGQRDLAAESLKQAIELGEEIGNHRAVSDALLQRAELRRDEGRLEEALADIQGAVAGVESARRNIPGDQLRIGFFAARRTYYDIEIDLLMRLDRAHPGKYAAQALEVSERARARGLLDLLAEGRIDVSQGLAPELRRREEDLSFKVSKAQIQLRSGSEKPERIRGLQEELHQLDRQREQLDLDIRAVNRRYADVRYPIPLKLGQIQSLVLDDQTALLEYALGKERSTLFVVTRQAIGTYELPAASVITEQVERLRKVLERESLLGRQDYLDLAFQLYRDLLQPASSVLAGKPKLLVVADGALSYIPFEALLTEPAAGRSYRDLPYLLRQHSVAYIPSASVLAGLREPRQEPVPADRKQVVAFAPFAGPGSKTATRGAAADSNPKPNPAASRWSFEPLPASLREISEIAGLYPEASLKFVGGEANEDAVTHNPAVAGARRLHFATHAKIDEDSPERSALVLSERPGEDGLLEVAEIFNLKLSADLAVLSACETALGKAVTGEGLVGLSRAFFYAGVPSLVVSLWNVVDGSTPDLMLDFYKNLDQLQDKAKALQAAKISMITRGTYAHPSYWAPFILLGEPR